MQKLMLRLLILSVMFFTVCTVDRIFADEAILTPPVRVMIVTGEDYPGHPWRETAPAITQILNGDPDIDARLFEDVEVLGSDLLFDYDVVLVHFKNYASYKRENQIKENLVRFVEQGGGLMYYHFACGAFEDWPEFEQIAGRVWDQQKRAHDPFGTFTVTYIDKDHPITAGLDDFEITDELYTCLNDGTVSIHVLAEARSVVDEKMYPIAFVFEKGKGRVFHTLLGHDMQALHSDGLPLLLRQAALWCAKR